VGAGAGLIKELGFALAVAVFLDALVVHCMLLPAVLELLGPRSHGACRAGSMRTAACQHRGLNLPRAARARSDRP